MKYFSDVLNKVYDTVEECEQAEREYEKRVQEEKQKREAERAHREALAAQREERKKDVDEAYEHARKLREAYLKDYQTYCYENNSPFSSLFDLWNW